jgi:hypothetical protein
LRTLLGASPDWSVLQNFLPDMKEQERPLERRSALASTFAATLEACAQWRAGITSGDCRPHQSAADGGKAGARPSRLRWNSAEKKLIA